MAKLRRLIVLMVLVILVITGFQLYWLKDNYARERASLHIKADGIFQESITRLEDSLLQKKLGVALKDTGRANLLKKSIPGIFLPRDSINLEYRTFNKISNPVSIRIRDSSSKTSLNLDTGVAENIKQIMVVKGTTAKATNDSNIIVAGVTHDRIRVLSQTFDQRRPGIGDTTNGIIYFDNGTGSKIMIRIDSLFNDSIPLDILSRSFGNGLRKAKTGIAYSVVYAPKEQIINQSPEGGLLFSRTLRYNYSFKGEAGYLMKRISLPILFSIFLIGITIVSFILLYRTLLQQQRLARSRSDLVSNITHELKTPIATVSVAIEALKNFSAINNREKTKEYLNISQQELQRLGLLVDKVLKLSMFDSKDLLLNKESIDLGELVKGVAASLKLQLEKSNTELKILTDGNLQMEGDRQHLQSVIFNLLDNSLKYNNNQSIDITTSIKGLADRIELSVKDNGIGIPQIHHSKIFEKFFRVPTGDTHNAKGHGLGLSYVASVVKQHGGTISVQSIEGLGSTFTIILPKHENGNH